MSQSQIFDVSGGVQSATNWVIKQPTEVADANNLRFDKIIGSAVRRYGYTLYKALATAGNKYPLAFYEAKFSTGVKIFYAYNNASNTNTVLSCYDPVTTTVTAIKSDYPPNCKLQMVINGGELYVAGRTTDTDSRQAIINIQKDLTVSTTRNIFGAPKAAFIGENSGALYAMNVELNGVVYPDRAYVSSPQKGAITYINAAVNNNNAPVTLVNQVPAMTGYTAPSGTASASTEVNTTEVAWKAFDRTTTNFWTANATTGWVQYDFGVGNTKTITYYAVTGGRATLLTRAPKTWTLQGSNDGTTFTTIDTQTNAPAFAAAESRTYSVSNTTAYRYYRMNITANQGDASNVDVLELSLFSSLTGVKELQAKVDSARYVKAGMPIDIYKAGTNTKMYSIVPTSVDNSKDTFNFLPYQQAVASADATADTITVSDATQFPTGTPIQLVSTGAVPGGLAASTTYYAINVSSTAIRVAVDLQSATIGSYINLTDVGTGNITLAISYIMSKTDELWLAGRHGDGTPSLLWNTDYRQPQTADFLFIAAGKVADTAITGWAKSNNRLNIFTKTSMWQYDNANFLPIYEDIGCISHDTICNNGNFIIWLDATGKVRARDSSTGKDQIISRAMKNNFFDSITAAGLAAASAIMIDSNYKITIGSISGKITRLVYNFDMNIWWIETHKRTPVLALNSSISGTRRSYFVDEYGNMFLDEEGNLDWTDSIPWYLDYGRQHLIVRAYNRIGVTISATKELQGIYMYTQNAVGSTVMVNIPAKGPDFITIGQIDGMITSIEIPETNRLEGRDFDFKIAGNQNGDPAVIEGIEIWKQTQQTTWTKD